MARYVSMLRGINVGGQRTVKMEDLKELYASLGFEHPRTYLQSGNVVFDGPDGDAAALERNISANIGKTLGLDATVIVRTADELRAVIDSMPFSGRNTEKLHVTFLSEKPAEFPLVKVERAKDSSEECVVCGREIYLFCPNGYGRTRLSNGFFERALKVSATTRNWRTVNSLASMASQQGTG